VVLRQDDAFVDRKDFKDYPRISDNYHHPGELVDGFVRCCRWCPLGVVGSVISGVFECSCRRSKEREQLSKAFDRSRSRLAYVNISLAAVLVIAAVVTLWLIVLDY
jgi:hypothetical protein